MNPPAQSFLPNPLTTLEKDNEALDFWQAVLESKHFATVIAAAQFIAEQNPPTMPGITEPMQVMALGHAAGIGARAQIAALGQCGAKAVHERMFAEGRMKQRNDVMAPSKAGQGPGMAARAADAVPPPPQANG